MRIGTGGRGGTTKKFRCRLDETETVRLMMKLDGDGGIGGVASTATSSSNRQQFRPLLLVPEEDEDGGGVSSSPGDDGTATTILEARECGCARTAMSTNQHHVSATAPRHYCPSQFDVCVVTMMETTDHGSSSNSGSDFRSVQPSQQYYSWEQQQFQPPSPSTVGCYRSSDLGTTVTNVIAWPLCVVWFLTFAVLLVCTDHGGRCRSYVKRRFRLMMLRMTMLLPSHHHAGSSSSSSLLGGRRRRGRRTAPSPPVDDARVQQQLFSRRSVDMATAVAVVEGGDAVPLLRAAASPSITSSATPSSTVEDDDNLSVLTETSRHEAEGMIVAVGGDSFGARSVHRSAANAPGGSDDDEYDVEQNNGGFLSVVVTVDADAVQPHPNGDATSVRPGDDEASHSGESESSRTASIRRAVLSDPWAGHDPIIAQPPLVPAEFGNPDNFVLLLEELYRLNSSDPHHVSWLWYSALMTRERRRRRGNTSRRGGYAGRPPPPPLPPPVTDVINGNPSEEGSTEGVSASITVGGGISGGGGFEDHDPADVAAIVEGGLASWRNRDWSFHRRYPPPHVRPQMQLILKKKRFSTLSIRRDAEYIVKKSSPPPPPIPSVMSPVSSARQQQRQLEEGRQHQAAPRGDEAKNSAAEYHDKWSVPTTATSKSKAASSASSTSLSSSGSTSTDDDEYGRDPPRQHRSCHAENSVQDSDADKDSIEGSSDGIGNHEDDDSSTTATSTTSSCCCCCCSICLCDIEEGDFIGDITCGHIFHKDCLKAWVRRNNRCPLCQHSNLVPSRATLVVGTAFHASQQPPSIG
jgi:Ring finger domain